jgi:hypothetical protein
VSIVVEAVDSMFRIIDKKAERILQEPSMKMRINLRPYRRYIGGLGYTRNKTCINSWGVLNGSAEKK